MSDSGDPPTAKELPASFRADLVITAGYVDAAHRRAVFAELRRFIFTFVDEIRPVPGTTQHRPTILCEDAPWKERFVPQAVLKSVLAVLEAHAEHASCEMGAFTMVRRDPQAVSDDDATASAAVAARAARPQRKARPSRRA
jgi:hypothetical protein